MEIKVRVRAGEMEQIKLRAKAAGVSIAGLCRQALGLPQLALGGRRANAGRPKKITQPVDSATHTIDSY